MILKKLIKVTKCSNCQEKDFKSVCASLYSCLVCGHVFKKTKLVEDTSLNDSINVYLRRERLADNYDKKIKKAAKHFYELGRQNPL